MIKKSYFGTLQVIIMAAVFNMVLSSCDKNAPNSIIDENGTDSGEINNNRNEPTITGKIDGYDYVDLGLSVKWAVCNIGANAPENYGSYFAWGELSEKSFYNLGNYSLYQNERYVDYGNDISQTTHDVAYVKWGKKWRMPTYEECNELEKKCSYLWVNYNGIDGCLFIGPNGNKLFLPAAGRIQGSTNGWEKQLVSLWGSTLWPWGNHFDITKCESAVAISIHKAGSPDYENLMRAAGCPVRAVSIATPDKNTSDDENNGNINPSNEPPYITNFTYTATKNSITVKFTATEKPTSATIKYGENSTNKTLSTSIVNKQISATAKGLKAGTKYYFKCTVKNSNGSSTSDDWPAVTNY